MRVSVDQSRCRGHGVCTSMAPDVFLVGDGERSFVRDDFAPDSRFDDVLFAADSCPEQAIEVSE